MRVIGAIVRVMGGGLGLKFLCQESRIKDWGRHAGVNSLADHINYETSS